MEGLLTRNTQAERLSVLETEMRTVIANQQQFHENWNEVNSKLDSLIGLKHKGMGAFWLASALAGTGIIGAFLSLFDWWKNIQWP